MFCTQQNHKKKNKLLSLRHAVRKGSGRERRWDTWSRPAPQKKSAQIRRSKFQRLARCFAVLWRKLGCLRTRHKHFRMKWSLKCPQRQSPSCRFKVSHKWLKISKALRATAAQVMLHPPLLLFLFSCQFIHQVENCHSRSSQKQVLACIGKNAELCSISWATDQVDVWWRPYRSQWELLNLLRLRPSKLQTWHQFRQRCRNLICNYGRKFQESVCSILWVLAIAPKQSFHQNLLRAASLVAADWAAGPQCSTGQLEDSCPNNLCACLKFDAIKWTTLWDLHKL